MSHFKQNEQPNRNVHVVNQQADYLTGQQESLDITRQWMLKTEWYPNNEGIPPAPLPPDISHLCYFDGRTPDEPELGKDREEGTSCLFSSRATSFDQNRNGWEPLNSVKTEPSEELYTRRSCSVPNDEQQPLYPVKVEPEEETVPPTKSNLYYGGYVESPRNRENVPCGKRLKESRNQQVLNRAKTDPEQATAKLLRNNQPILGFNVYIENPRNGILGSCFQTVSCGLSSESNYTEYWLPILSHIDDWPSIKGEFLSAVDRICMGIGFVAAPAKVFKVCSSLMNSAVVKIMECGRSEMDSNAYINGFFSIYRILNKFAQDEEGLIELSNRQLANFMASSAGRVKKAVPNLGEFLMHLTVSTQWTWTQISKAFMDESYTRNVFWYCIGTHKSPALYPELINVDQYRSDRESKVFHATAISRSLIMFQVKFASMTKSSEFTEFCTNSGRVQDILTTKLKNLRSAVIAIENWDQFYDFLQMPRVSLTKRNIDLAEAVMRSAIQGYHKRSASAMRAEGSKRRRMR